MFTTIVISNQKGGVAKTTTCLSLGACLAEMGHKVLLIDLDPQAHLTLSLGIKPDESCRTVGDVLLENASLLGVSWASSTKGLDIVPANKDLDLIDGHLSGRNGCETRLKRELGAISETTIYDYVLLDCAPSPSVLNLNALTAARLIIIPVQCEYYAALSLRKSIEQVKSVQVKSNSDLNYQILATLYDRRNRLCQFILEELRRELNHKLFDTIIEIDTKLRESSAFGQPITCYAPRTRGAQQYRALARELTNYGQ